MLIRRTAREFQLHSTKNRVAFQVEHTCLHRCLQGRVRISAILSLVSLYGLLLHPRRLFRHFPVSLARLKETTAARFVWVGLSDGRLLPGGTGTSVGRKNIPFDHADSRHYCERTFNHKRSKRVRCTFLQLCAQAAAKRRQAASFRNIKSC